MNAIALCHNRDLQKTNGRIIVLGTGSVSPMQTAAWVNMQFVLHLDYEMVWPSVRLWYVSVSWTLPSTRPSLSHAVVLGSTFSSVDSKTDQRLQFSEACSQTGNLFLYSTCLPEMRPCFVVCWLQRTGKIVLKSWAKRSVNKRSNQACEQNQRPGTQRNNSPCVTVY